MLAKRTQEQLEEIVRRKQSLSLDLKRAAPAFLDNSCSPNACDETVFTCNSKSFQEASSRKHQIASDLNLLPQSIPSSDTAETFHTAAADSPVLRIAFEDADTMCISDLTKNEEESATEESQDGHDDRCSSEVKMKNTTNANRAASMELVNDERNMPMTSTIQETMLQDTLESPIQQNPAMKRLNQRIARQRMMVMRCLDAGTPSKDDLNRQIMILQDLQRQQIELEVSLLEDERKTYSTKQLQCGSDGDGDGDGDRLANNETENYVQNEPNDYCSVVEPTNNSSAILLTVAQTRSQLFRNNRPSTNDQETLSESLASKRSSNRGYSTVYLTVGHFLSCLRFCQSCNDFNTDTFFAQSQNRGDRLSSPYSLTITRSLPSLIANDGDCVINMIVSVPSYVIRGAGASSHYEYEVRVIAQDDSWTLLRRYRRFRELYISMRQKYGSKVRQLFHEIIMA